MPGTRPGHHHPAGVGQVGARGPGPARRRVGRPGPGRAEHGHLAHVAVGAEHPEGLGHLGQGGVGDLEVADGRALAGQRPDDGQHRAQQVALGPRQRPVAGQRAERCLDRARRRADRAAALGTGTWPAGSAGSAEAGARRDSPRRSRGERRRSAVEGGALDERAAERGDQASASSSTPMRWPWLAPAAREMFSSMSVPPRSLAPARRHWRAPSTPSFTQLTWMLSMAPR